MQRVILSLICFSFIIGLFATQTSQALSQRPSYVALGDSVAAGAGLPLSSSASSEDQLCLRSSQAYPYKIAAKLRTTVTQLACSGAKVDEGIYGTQTIGERYVSAQLPQAFNNGTPELMTITIGANDARWTSFIKQCYAYECGKTIDTIRAKAYRADLRVELFRALYKIKAMSNGIPPKVLLSGYYTPFTRLGCTDMDGRITVSENQWLRDQTANLNQAIKSVIQYFSFASYVPVSFSGHEICSPSPWIQDFNDSAPLHPTAAGQTALSRAYLSALGR